MVLTIIDHDKEPIVKQKKTGLVLTVIGGIWIFRVFVFLVFNIYIFALIVSIIISIIGGIIGLQGKKIGSLISLIAGILNALLIIILVSRPAYWYYDFFYSLYVTFLLLFLTPTGFGNFGIPFLLLLIGGIISFKETRKNFKDHVYE
jgi:hypothetical protein